MRTILLAPLLLVACATTGDSQPVASGRLDALIAGRTAGATTDCIDQIRVDNLSAVDTRTIVAGTGRRVWINRLPETCPAMQPGSILIVQSYNAQYCRNDMVTDAARGDPGWRVPARSIHALRPAGTLIRPISRRPTASA